MITQQPFQLSDDDLNQMEASNSPQESPQSMGSQPQGSGLLSQIAGTSPVQTILGAGDAIRNTLASGLNMLPNVNIPMVNSAQYSQETPYRIGNMGGNIAAFMGGGDILDTMRAAAEGLPYAGQAAQWLGQQGMLPTAARQALGSAAYGAAAAPDDRLQNAWQGAKLSAMLSALPAGANVAAKAFQYLQPQKYIQSMLNTMSGGQSMQDATKSVLSAVKSAYQKQKEEAGDLYSTVNSSLPSSHIYENVTKPNPLMSTDPQAGYSGYFMPQSSNLDIKTGLSGEYPNLPDSIFNSYSPDLKELHDQFMENPNFQNAHALQSELGSVSAQLSKGVPQNMSAAFDRNSLNTARGALKRDISNFIGNQSQDLLQKYNKASDFFQNNVVPYRSDPAIYSVASGDRTNIAPTALANLFKAKEPDVAKVVSDLPPGTVDKILYTQLGKNTPSQNPFAFLRAAGRMNEQGLGDYLTPELQQNIDSLQSRLKWRSAAQSIAGMLVGGHAGAAHGGGGMAAMGAVGGAMASPVLNYLGRRLFPAVGTAGNAISNVGNAVYPDASKAILANLLNQTGRQNGS